MEQTQERVLLHAKHFMTWIFHEREKICESKGKIFTERRGKSELLEGLIEIYFSFLNKTVFEWMENTLEANLCDFPLKHSSAECFSFIVTGLERRDARAFQWIQRKRYLTVLLLFQIICFAVAQLKDFYKL